jgi:hypothetical protein
LRLDLIDASLIAVAERLNLTTLATLNRREAEVESVVCELRRAHPKWGPKRLARLVQTRAEAADRGT